jgi:hypothetical protein
VSKHFGETRPLYVAGALLTRLQPPPPCSHEDQQHCCPYDYTAPHVDKSNMASYDYSAVVYLNSKGGSFDGGDFCFNGLAHDELVEPRQGRCVLFASGPHHLHQARRVERGARFILAVWFTLSAAHAEAALLPPAAAPGAPPPAPSATEASDGDGVRAAEQLVVLQTAVEYRLAQLSAELGADAPHAAVLLERLALQRSSPAAP